MPQIIVTITYDQPTDPYWLNPDNVRAALEAYCPSTRFSVGWAEDGEPDEWLDDFSQTHSFFG